MNIGERLEANIKVIIIDTYDAVKRVEKEVKEIKNIHIIALFPILLFFKKINQLINLMNYNPKILQHWILLF